MNSIITGTRAMSGSAATRLRKVTIAFSESSRPSSILTSMICAPLATCSRATSSAVAKSPLVISLRKRAEPVTLVRSPTLTKGISGVSVNGSRPDSRRSRGGSGIGRGALPATASAMALIWAGVVPQQPPAMLISPAEANSPISVAMCSGLSS